VAQPCAVEALLDRWDKVGLPCLQAIDQARPASEPR
jgi:hypothetical protein